MSAKEILKNVFDKYIYDTPLDGQLDIPIYEAMKEDAVSFMKWANSEGWQPYDAHDTMIHFESRKVLEVKNLYNQYQKEKL